jgi:excinuclease ABC subunit A
MEKILIRGARQHNLKNISLELPRNKLIVITGKSGSGKSSLAFDTIFAEGQRRYIESLSSYARQFLGQLDKPDVDDIQGLSPSIAIEQKTTHRNPRSTVGTVTEIYDYYRLLYARIGEAFCPVCGQPIRPSSLDQILQRVLELGSDRKLMVLAPVIRGKKGEHQKVFQDAKKLGYQRVRLNGQVQEIDQVPSLDKKKKHTVEIVVDRLVSSTENRLRLSEAIQAALRMASGLVVVVDLTETPQEHFFSEKASCPTCDFQMPDLEPRLFSFNSPFGACPTCSGLGIVMEFDPKLIAPDPTKSFLDRGFLPYNPESGWSRSWFQALARRLNFDLATPIKDLPKSTYRALFYGTDDKVDVVYENKAKTGRFEYSTHFLGIIGDLNRRYRETTSPEIRQWLERFQSRKTCPTCQRQRLRQEALAVRVGVKNISELTQLSVEQSLRFFEELELNKTQTTIAAQILKEIQARLGFLHDVGLDYLTLDREAGTLSGGEAQRIRLATQIGSGLMGVLYVLDEPTIGLHQRDNEKLINTLLRLRDLGNTLIVVEHDEQTIRTADYIVDLGPGSGVHGGEVISQGPLSHILKDPKSLTGKYLSGKIQMPLPTSRRAGNGQFLRLRGARKHNLKSISVDIPLGTFVVITGVSGSGKSTLMGDILFPALTNRLSENSQKLEEGDFDSIEGVKHLDKVISIDQSPIGRTPRSNPATYVGLFGPIRDVFAQLPESKARGYKSGRFSFNVKGGRCESCEGAGVRKIEMNFLPDVYVVCDVCHGKRFNSDTLDIHFKGKNIYDVLEMTVQEASEFFSAFPAIATKLRTLESVGLGYIKLGQNALTLSGGEAQRVKLSLELSKKATGKTIYLIDEPTTGLHFDDVRQLIETIQRLVDKGNTVLMIEHNLDMIANADWIIDLGPEGGDRGGTVIVQGPPEQVMANPASYTGQFLKEYLARS